MAAVLVAAVLCVLVAMQSGIERTELTQAANKAATLPAVPGESTQPANPAATKKLFAYLSADSYTPQVRSNAALLACPCVIIAQTWV